MRRVAPLRPDAGQRTRGSVGVLFRVYAKCNSVPFNRRLIVGWEHGGVDDATTPYRATMLWYGTPRQTAERTDRLVAGDPASAAKHHYQSPGQQLTSLSAAYEYQPFAPLSTGIVATPVPPRPSPLKLSGNNTGAFLRRTFDSCVAGQRAKIYIDGKYAGTWFDAGVSPGTGYDGHQRCWRDQDFPLPAALTAGKTAITIKVQPPGPNTTWTASAYTSYSFVL